MRMASYRGHRKNLIQPPQINNEFPGAPFKPAFVLEGDFHSACLVMFSSTPIQASVTNNDDPPYDTSGSGMPLVGIIPSTTLMLMKACMTTMLVMPTAR